MSPSRSFALAGHRILRSGLDGVALRVWILHVAIVGFRGLVLLERGERAGMLSDVLSFLGKSSLEKGAIGLGRQAC